MHSNPDLDSNQQTHLIQSKPDRVNRQSKLEKLIIVEFGEILEIQNFQIAKFRNSKHF